MRQMANGRAFQLTYVSHMAQFSLQMVPFSLLNTCFLFFLAINKYNITKSSYLRHLSTTPFKKIEHPRLALKSKKAPLSSFKDCSCPSAIDHPIFIEDGPLTTLLARMMVSFTLSFACPGMGTGYCEHILQHGLLIICSYLHSEHPISNFNPQE